MEQERTEAKPNAARNILSAEETAMGEKAKSTPIRAEPRSVTDESHHGVMNDSLGISDPADSTGLDDDKILQSKRTRRKEEISPVMGCRLMRVNT